jgi:3-hydroxyisobutyrate dehydrogenase-like beta-hydroxyacid dehydrogenase
MGKGMVKNLAQKTEGSLVIWNRSRDVCEEIALLYPNKIIIAATASDVIKQCQITFCMLSTLEASEAVFDAEEGGIISSISEGKIIVDCATLSPERMIFESQKITERYCSIQ